MMLKGSGTEGQGTGEGEMVDGLFGRTEGVSCLKPGLSLPPLSGAQRDAEEQRH